jgi:hypothetical protein
MPANGRASLVPCQMLATDFGPVPRHRDRAGFEVIELYGAGARRQERIRIVNRDGMRRSGESTNESHSSRRKGNHYRLIGFTWPSAVHFAGRRLPIVFSGCIVRTEVTNA